MYFIFSLFKLLSVDHRKGGFNSIFPDYFKVFRIAFQWLAVIDSKLKRQIPEAPPSMLFRMASCRSRGVRAGIYNPL
jgi:hypothetical protein